MKKSLPVLLLFCLAFSLSAIEIKHLREITLSQTDEAFIQKAGSFIVTEDETVIVFDSGAGNIKSFDINGKPVGIFGRKGLGPNEFIRPKLSAYKAPYIAFADFGRKSFFIYKRKDRNSFEFVNSFLSLGMCYDLQLIGDGNLLVAGYKIDNDRKEYHLYTYDFKDQKYEFILPSEVSYGFNSIKRYKKEYNERLSYIGLMLFCDFSADSIYFAWTGDIDVLKIDRKTYEITSFGKKTENFSKPSMSAEIKRAYARRNHKLIYRLRSGMSYVRDIFVSNSNKVGLVYVGPLKKNKGMIVMVQVYSGEGEFSKEFGVLNAGASNHYDLYFYFNKDRNLFYIMDIETSKEFDQFYKVHEYRIVE